MLKNLPFVLTLFFIATTALTVLLVDQAIKKSSNAGISRKAGVILFCMLIWLAIQAALALANVYSANLHSLPPKLMVFGILPMLALIITLFASAGGRKFMDGLSLQEITMIHIIRIPVELVLAGLFLRHAIPQLMTFEGRNFDILSGITAPLIVYFGFKRKTLHSKIIMIWNIAALGLLLNVVIIAMLSAPFPFQRLAFDQPDIGILYFPFSWLPSFIVPAVLFAHMVAIRKLMTRTSIPNV